MYGYCPVALRLPGLANRVESVGRIGRNRYSRAYRANKTVPNL
ncbi:hypothetical protein ATN83_4504 [Raoultella ornithinolytica]|nr:hypothetical protein ATN83_4504 [Raoultella ornithinolytica]BDA56869.1 hypothetical protein NUITMVR1_45280 [Raoultella ornithinolytica]